MKTAFIKMIWAVALMVSAQTAMAACSRADLTGTWRAYFTLGSVARCSIVMPATGTAIASNSSCYIPGSPTKAITGTLAITTDCHVTGKVTVSGTVRQADAWLNKSKDTMAGIGWDPAYVWDGDTFNAIKQ